MERSEIISHLEVINQQVSSSILGGMETYEELEAMGLVKINRDDIQWSAAMTPAGNSYLGHD